MNRYFGVGLLLVLTVAGVLMRSEIQRGIIRFQLCSQQSEFAVTQGRLRGDIAILKERILENDRKMEFYRTHQSAIAAAIAAGKEHIDFCGDVFTVDQAKAQIKELHQAELQAAEDGKRLAAIEQSAADSLNSVDIQAARTERELALLPVSESGKSARALLAANRTLLASSELGMMSTIQGKGVIPWTDLPTVADGGTRTVDSDRWVDALLAQESAKQGQSLAAELTATPADIQKKLD